MALSDTELQELIQSHDIQGLMNALEAEKHSGKIRRALVQTGSAALDVLLPHLQAEDASFRRVIVRILGEIRDERAVDPLIHVLKHDEEWRVHGDVVMALARIGSEKAIDTVIEATDELVRGAKEKQGELSFERTSHIEALGVSRNEAAIPSLKNTLANDPDWYMQSKSLTALGLIGGEEALTILRVYVGNADHRLSEAAIRALGMLGDNRASQHIKELIDEQVYRGYRPPYGKKSVPDPERGIAPAAIRQGVVEALQLALQDERFRSRKAAIEELEAFGDIASESLFAMMKDEHEEVSGAAVQSIAAVGDERSIALLREALEDTKVAHFAVLALYKIGKAAVETLIFALESGNPWVRNAAAEALGLLGDARAISALQARLDDLHPQIGRSAFLALKKFGAVEDIIQQPKEIDMPVLAYRVRNAWNSVLGSDSASFILYQSGRLIFVSSDKPDSYQTVHLSEVEQANLLAGIPFAELEPMQGYSLTHATDQPVFSFYIRHGEQMHWLMVEGSLEREDTSQLPPFILELYRRIKTFEHPQAVNWFPEKIEVLLWAFPYAQNEGLLWPESWPHLFHPETVHRGNLEKEGVYSIYLDYQHFQKLDEMVKSGEPIALNKRKWAIKYRYPIPQEIYLSPTLKR